MLTTCPECCLQVSDKAITCPHCGYPFTNIELLKPKRRTRKHLKLPNGFGRITKLSNPRLRNQYRAMVTVGTDEYGKPIGRLLKPKAYFATYNEAYEALVEYNKHGYDLNDCITIKELYEIWSEKYFATIEPSATRTITAAWAYCSELYYIPVRSLKAHQIKTCMESGTAEYKGVIRTPSASTKNRIKSLFNLMLDYAVEYEYTDKNVARTFKLSGNILADIKAESDQHIRLTNEELMVLWENIDVSYVDTILIQCYTGWRPQELGLIKLENIDLENWSISGGMKTEAGTNRVVPIHTGIRDLIVRKYNDATAHGSEYLFNCVDGRSSDKYTKLTYDIYYRRFKRVMTDLGLNPNHKAHDPRKTFVSLAKDASVDQYAIKKIVGHRISDITEAVYTTRDPRWLHTEIEKIKVPVITTSN